MSSIKLPSGYTIYGYSNNGDTVTAYKDDSSSAAPHFIIIDRTRAAFNQQSMNWSVPTYRVRVIRGNVDVNGNPVTERTLADITFRSPVGKDPQIEPLIEDVRAIIADVNLEDSILGLLLPTCCEDAEAE